MSFTNRGNVLPVEWQALSGELQDFKSQQAKKVELLVLARLMEEPRTGEQENPDSGRLLDSLLQLAGSSAGRSATQNNYPSVLPNRLADIGKRTHRSYATGSHHGR